MTKDRTKELQAQTSGLLKKIKAETISPKDIGDLRKILRFHENRYYILNDPLISDFEYDQLYKQLYMIP